MSRRFAYAGIVFVALLASAWSVGCGGSTSAGGGSDASSDGTVVDSPSPPDSTTDAGSDGTSGSDGGTDSAAGDTGSGTDSSPSDAANDTGGGDAGTCDPNTCAMPGFGCCGNECVDLQNDIRNCGRCNNPCGGPHPYCDMGTCGTPPCNGIACPANEFCCGTQCCMAGQLCCSVPGPVGNVIGCNPPDPTTGSCPPGCSSCVCASPDTPIATPQGERRIADLAVGDLVYSVAREAIVAVPVARTHRVPVHDHHVVRVRLASGAVLEISPLHPTADGRTLGDLRAGDMLDGIVVVSAELVPYAHAFTYDILPASETHTYFAGGALIGTTLR